MFRYIKVEACFYISMDPFWEKEGKPVNIREEQERWELQYLSPYASHAADSAGRDRWEEQCDMRTVYQRDRDRIIHCKSFRRLKHKTQVFLAPEGDHYRTRLTHTLEVAQIARSIARALRLNEDLTEAIALGHDLGHTPYGHAGEAALDAALREDGFEQGFKHYEQSIRVVEKLEKDGAGLNLTKEVRDGILNHGTSNMPSTMEGKVVRLSDKIAYINHDIDDAIRAHIMAEEDIPKEYSRILGGSTGVRLDTLIHDVILNSMDKPDIVMSGERYEAMRSLRSFMFQSVYTNPTAKSEEVKAKKLLRELYEYYKLHTEELPESYRQLIMKKNEPVNLVVCDYIAGMSDQYVIYKFEEIFVPRSWKVR